MNILEKEQEYGLYRENSLIATFESSEEAIGKIPSEYLPLDHPSWKLGSLLIADSRNDGYSVRRVGDLLVDTVASRIRPILISPKYSELKSGFTFKIWYNQTELTNVKDMAEVRKIIPRGFLTTHDWEVRREVNEDPRANLGFAPNEQDHYRVDVHQGETLIRQDFYYGPDIQPKEIPLLIGVDFFGAIADVTQEFFEEQRNWGDVKPIDGAFEALKRLNQLSHGGVTIITLGSPKQKNLIKLWLHRQGLEQKTGIPLSTIHVEHYQNALSEIPRVYHLDSFISHWEFMRKEMRTRITRLWELNPSPNSFYGARRHETWQNLLEAMERENEYHL